MELIEISKDITSTIDAMKFLLFALVFLSTVLNLGMIVLIKDNINLKKRVKKLEDINGE